MVGVVGTAAEAGTVAIVVTAMEVTTAMEVITGTVPAGIMDTAVTTADGGLPLLLGSALVIPPMVITAIRLTVMLTPLRPIRPTVIPLNLPHQYLSA